MPVYAEMSGDLKVIEFRTNIAVAQVVSVTAEDFLRIVKEEIPWDSIKDDVIINYGTVIGSRNSRNQVSTQIIIGSQSGANEYIFELWKGSASERTHTAQGKAMRFDNWPKGPDTLRSADGFYYFKTVNHPKIPGNDFVGRAIARLRLLVQTQFGRKFSNYFKNIKR